MLRTAPRRRLCFVFPRLGGAAAVKRAPTAAGSQSACARARPRSPARPPGAPEGVGGIRRGSAPFTVLHKAEGRGERPHGPALFAPPPRVAGRVPPAPPPLPPPRARGEVRRERRGARRARAAPEGPRGAAVRRRERSVRTAPHRRGVGTASVSSVGVTETGE